MLHRSPSTHTKDLLPTLDTIEIIHNICLIPLSPSRLALLLPMCYNLPSRTPMNGIEPQSCHRAESSTATTSRTTILKTPVPSALACIPHRICINNDAHNAAFPQDRCTRKFLVGLFQHHSISKSTCAIRSLTSRRLKEERWKCFVSYFVCM